MYDFILQIIFMFSAGMVIYILARAIPRVNDTHAKQPTAIEFLSRLTKKLPLDKIDAALSVVLSKSIRRSRIGIMKIDNWLGRSLSKLRNGDNGGGSGQTNLFQRNRDKKE